MLFSVLGALHEKAVYIPVARVPIGVAVRSRCSLSAGKHLKTIPDVRCLQTSRRGSFARQPACCFQRAAPPPEVDSALPTGDGRPRNPYCEGTCASRLIVMSRGRSPEPGSVRAVGEFRARGRTEQNPGIALPPVKPVRGKRNKRSWSVCSFRR